MSASTAATTAPKSDDATVSVPDAVVITAKSAVATWQGAEERIWTLQQNNKLEFSYNASQQTAFLILHTYITLQALPPKQKLGFRLFVDPERVQSIKVDESTTTPAHVQTTLGTNAWRLHLHLARPADLIVPKLDLKPRGSSSTQARDGLYALAQSTHFDILLPHRAATKASLAKLCEAFATCKCDPQQLNLNSLYHGKGGIVLDSKALTTRGKEVDNPPSYDELGPGPPMPPLHPSRPEKRRRESDSGEFLHLPAQTNLEAACRKVFEEGKAALKADLRTELQAELQEEFRETNAAIRDLEAQTQRIRDDTLAVVHEELGSLKESLTNQIEGLRREVDDNVDSQIEETGMSLRVELQEFVRDEMRDVERRIRGRLGGRTFTAYFQIDDSDSENT